MYSDLMISTSAVVTAVATIVVAAATVFYVRLTNDMVSAMRKQHLELSLPLVSGSWASTTQSDGTAIWAMTIKNSGSGHALDTRVQRIVDSHLEDVKVLPVMSPGEVDTSTRISLRLDSPCEMRISCVDICDRRFSSTHVLRDPTTSLKFRLSSEQESNTV